MPETISKPESPIFLKLKEATFYHNQILVFDKINWEIKSDEQWAVIGPVGSGKTSLMEALLGKYALRHGEINYPFLEKHKSNPDAYLHILDVAAIISFQENSYLFNYSDFFYQQRFNSSHAEGIITAGEFLQHSFTQQPAKQDIEEVSRLFGIEDLLELEFIKLSNGQTRRLRIAKALLKKPALLILDNPFVGLDTNAREDLHLLIRQLIAHGTKIILTTHQLDIPEGITNILELENFTIKGNYNKEEFLQLSTSTVSRPFNAIKTVPLLRKKPEPDFETAVRFEHVDVNYGEKQALQNINWTVKKGDKWALLGPNGSGKSTILSLINADHPQAYANSIYLFDRKRGSGESIWEIKKKIGFISPELHLYFRRNMNCAEVVATGLFDTLVLNQPLTNEDTSLVESLFSFYDITHLLQKKFLEISSGQQRLMLLMRSLIKNPDLIIWDEPFQGLDEKYIHYSTLLLQEFCKSSTTLIFVTHYLHEIPSFVNKFLFLEEGKISRIVSS